MSAKPQISIVLLTLCLLFNCVPSPGVEAPAARPAAESRPAERLDSIVKVWLKRPELQNSQLGLEIMELPSGRVFFNYNANKRFVPASAAKVFTTACAMDTLGPEFRYRTRLLAYGKVKGDRLQGDLVLETSEDPTLEISDLSQLLQTLKEKNIRHVTGTLEMLPVPGGFDYFSPYWLVEDWGQEWMPVSSNLVVDHNLAPLRGLGKGLLPVAIEPFGHIAENALTRSLLESGITAGWASFDTRNWSVRAFRPAGPEMGGAGSLIIANPDQYNVAILTNMAKAAGIRFGSRSLSAGFRETPQVLAEHESKPLKDVIEITLKESDNLYAQQLLRTIAVKTRGPHERGSLEDSGMLFLKNWLLRLGIPAREVVLFDACGLSRKNAISPHALNTVLRHMAGPQVSGPYLDLMRFEGNGRSRAGSFEFKTGAMDTVRSISGVLRTAANEALAVTIIVNGHKVSVGELRVAFFSLTSQLRHVELSGTGPVLSPPAPAKPRPARRTKRSRRSAFQAAPVASAKKPAPVAGAKKPAPVAGVKKPAPVAGAKKPAPVAGAKKPAPVAGAKEPAPAAKPRRKRR